MTSAHDLFAAAIASLPLVCILVMLSLRPYRPGR